jgi:holo-[acyl-carrier protein] synthase
MKDKGCSLLLRRSRLKPKLHTSYFTLHPFLMIRLGTDIIYIPRIQAAVERFGDRFLQRVYTPAEQLDCGWGKNSPSRAAINKLAGRWAAKEAVVKALGTGWRGVSYTDVEIRRQLGGAPIVHLHGRAIAAMGVGKEVQWQLSLSHDGDYAIATALLVGSETDYKKL